MVLCNHIGLLGYRLASIYRFKVTAMLWDFLLSVTTYGGTLGVIVKR